MLGSPASLCPASKRTARSAVAAAPVQGADADPGVLRAPSFTAGQSIPNRTALAVKLGNGGAVERLASRGTTNAANPGLGTAMR